MCALQPAHVLAYRLPRPAPGITSQEQGMAVVTSPLEGTVVSGIVPITGTATHPQFQRYEIAFGYSPNPSDGWFSIQDPATTQVANDILGRWDTTGITDGVYTVRLRVYWSDRSYLEAFARNVRVQNATPTPPPQPTATGTEPPTALAVEAAATEPLIALPPTSTPRPTLGAPGVSGGGPTAGFTSRLNAQAIASAFFDGVRFTFIAFLLMGAYAGLRAALRSRARR